MNLTELSAISPIDGRYRNKVSKLANYFSEYALIRYRVKVEVEYFIALCQLPLPQLANFNSDNFPILRKLYLDFSEEDALTIKTIEKTTNHDVKAVEYFIKQAFDLNGLDAWKEFIHFGLTSQDINNTATPLSMKEAMKEQVYPTLRRMTDKLLSLADEWKEVSMLARTHGQPASPTRLGKEIMVFAERLEKQIQAVQLVPYSAKFGGATGNFNAHHVAYPAIDWVEFGNTFVNHVLELDRSQTTTQIEHYDNFAALFDGLKRIGTILIDMNRDIWTYISLDYFKQKIKAGEIGSSAMPHKVNPIDFENAEGNLGIANALFEHLAAKLPISRLQRDLTDSTVLRNIGVPVSHLMIALESTLKGLDKLILNPDKIKDDLELNAIVIAEGIQTILRREAYPNPYEALKELTRQNKRITQADFEAFISQLNVSDAIKKELYAITPFNYTGI